jgi:hypothetical protein
MAEYHKETIRLKKLTGAIKKILKSKTKVNNLTNDGELDTIYTLAEEVSSGSEFVLIPAGQESEYYTTSEINSTFEKISSYNAKKANKLTKSAVDDIATNNPSNVVYPPTITASVANPINPGSSITLHASGAFSAFKEHNSLITYEWKLPDNSTETGEYINFTTYTSDRGKSFTIYCTAIDAYGNRSNPANYVVNVRENTAPLISKVIVANKLARVTPLQVYDNNYNHDHSYLGYYGEAHQTSQAYPYYTGDWIPSIAYKIIPIWVEATDAEGDNINFTFTTHSDLGTVNIYRPFKKINSNTYLGLIYFKPTYNVDYNGTTLAPNNRDWWITASDGIESRQVKLAPTTVYYLNYNMFKNTPSLAQSGGNNKNTGGLSQGSAVTLNIPSSNKKVWVYENVYYNSILGFHDNMNLKTTFTKKIWLNDGSFLSKYSEAEFNPNQSYANFSFEYNYGIKLSSYIVEEGKTYGKSYSYQYNYYTFEVKSDKKYVVVNIQYRFDDFYIKVPFIDAAQTGVVGTTYTKRSGYYYVVQENKPPYYYNYSKRSGYDVLYGEYVEFVFNVADPEGKPVTVTYSFHGKGGRFIRDGNRIIGRIATGTTLKVNNTAYGYFIFYISDGVNTTTLQTESVSLSFDRD